MIALSSSVSSLSVIVTVVANVASATEILPVPSKDVPPMVLAVARAVAVSALPVTSPVKGPAKASEVTVPSKKASLNSTPLLPRSKILSAPGVNAPSVSINCFSFPA